MSDAKVATTHAVALLGAAIILHACNPSSVSSARLVLLPGAQPSLGLLAVGTMWTESGCGGGQIVRAVRDSNSRWSSAPLPELGNVHCGGERQWLITPSGREYIAFDGRGAEFWTSMDGAAWARATPSPSLPRGVASSLESAGSLGRSWVARDGTLRALVGPWLVSVAGAEVTGAIPTGRTCAIDRLCLFSPTSDTHGHSAAYEAAGQFSLYEFECTADACTWTLRGPLGTDRGGSTEHRPFFHTTAGVPVFVHPVSGASELRRPLGLDTNTSHQLVSEEDVFVSDAGPLSNGGVAIAAVTYTGELQIYTSGPDLRFSRSVLREDSVGAVALLVVPSGGGYDDVYVASFRGFRAEVIRVASDDRRVLATEELSVPSP